MVCRFKGPLTAFRIADKRNPLLDGTGAALHGGRWNSPGRKAIYAVHSYEGALLEKLALAGRVGDIPKTQQSIKIQVPKDILIEEIVSEDLPGWNSADFIQSRKYGDLWLWEKRTAILVVPALISPEEKTVIFNPEHPDFQIITVSQPKDVVWDPSLFHPKG
jgi:RES domain-containing protein